MAESPTYDRLVRRVRELEMENAALRREQNMVREESNASRVLNEQPAFQGQLLDSVREALIATDLEGRVIYWGKGAKALYGYSVEETIGKPVSMIVPSSHHAAVRDRMAQVFHSGFWAGNTFRLRKDGSTFEAETAISLASDAGGNRIGIIGIDRDISEQKRMGKALRESERKFRMLFDKAPLAYQSLNEFGRIIEVNQAWLDALGYTREEVIGQSFGDFLHPESRDHFRENFPRFKAVGEILGIEFEMIKKNGNAILVSFNGKIMRNDQGDFQRTHCIFHDVTEQRKADEALWRSEREKEAILHGLKDVIVEYVDREMRIIWTNAAMHEQFGNFEDNLAGRHCYRVVQDLDSPCPGCTAARAFETGRFQEGEVTTPDDRTFLVRSNPVKNADGDIEGVVHAALNITERKWAEEALKWELAVSKAVAGLSRSLLSSNYRIETISKQVLDYAKEITGSAHGYVSFIDPESRNNVSFTLTEMLKGGCSAVDRRITFPIGEDGVYPCLWGHALNTRESFFTNAPQTHPQSRGVPEGHLPLERFLAVPVMIEGAPAGKIALANPDRDYTDSDLNGVERLGEVYALALHRQRFETEREGMQRQLQQSQKLEAIGALAGGIAHDFNNILFPIIGYAEMGLDECPPGSLIRDSLEEILKGAERARELVRQILMFSRQSEHQLKPMRIQFILKEVLQLIRSSLPTTIDIRQDIGRDCGPVMADPIQIHSMAMNLFTNAYHAMQETGGRIEVRLAETTVSSEDPEWPDLEPGPYVRFSVSDTGKGMAPDVQERIFDPYFTTKELGKGTGLGLSVVHGIVKNYGGAIRVESAPGRGTTFHICLPRIKTASARHAADSPFSAAPRGEERVLLVDDEPQIVRMEKQMLERLGYAVTTRTSSTEALELFRHQPDRFDLVITDMTMPGLRGDQLAAELIAVRADIPIILCTGFSESIDEEEAAALGIRKYIMKPIVKKDLAEAIREVLDPQTRA